MVARLTSRQQVARYQDVQLVGLLAGEPAQAEEFLADTLGHLLRADEDIRAAVLTSVRELGSASRTAARLYTHRNTVRRCTGAAPAEGTRIWTPIGVPTSGIPGTVA